MIYPQNLRADDRVPTCSSASTLDVNAELSILVNEFTKSTINRDLRVFGLKVKSLIPHLGQNIIRCEGNIRQELFTCFCNCLNNIPSLIISRVYTLRTRMFTRHRRAAISREFSSKKGGYFWVFQQLGKLLPFPSLFGYPFRNLVGHCDSPLKEMIQNHLGHCKRNRHSYMTYIRLGRKAQVRTLTLYESMVFGS